MERAQDRIALPCLQESRGVVVQRQHTGDLPAHRVHVRAAWPVDRAVHPGLVLPHLDPDLVLVAVQAERQAHDVARGGVALPEPERDGLRQ
jgi:hypothetical protein